MTRATINMRSSLDNLTYYLACPFPAFMFCVTFRFPNYFNILYTLLFCILLILQFKKKHPCNVSLKMLSESFLLFANYTKLAMIRRFHLDSFVKYYGLGFLKISIP
jgi:hypothetical protein